jgi:hypothetical protein
MVLKGGMCLDNVLSVVQELPDEDVVAWLDGDDWLAHDDVAATVLEAHQAGAWVTWGQFIHWPSYASGWASDFSPEIAEPRNYRYDQWRSTHLKTFRAGLFKRIRWQDLTQPSGDLVERARDCAVMFPLLEMAGPRRTKFLPAVSYIYNTPRYGAEEYALQCQELDRIRLLPKYDLVDAL